MAGDYTDLQVPGMLAFAVAVISIAIKEAMYWHTRHYALQIHSSALMADAWHHRSDAFSSIGALVGIAKARMGYPIMDSVASFVIFFFIAKAAADIFKDAVDKMVDHSYDEETEKKIHDCGEEDHDVLSIDLLLTRIFGNRIYADVEIRADGNSILKQANEVAERIHENIEQRFPEVKHIMVHANQDE